MFEIAYKKEEARFPMPPHTHNAIEVFLSLSELPNVLLGEQGDLEYRYFKESQIPLIILLTEKQKKEIVEKMEKLSQCGSSNAFRRMKYFFEVLEGVHQLVGMADGEATGYIMKQLSGTARTVSEMVDYINEHLYEKITIEDIAARFYLNHDYAARIFKKHVNTTIRNFITLQRITKAQQLLLEGETVAQVQLKTGYGSYEHFFRTFKKITGMTPKEYQENYFDIKKEIYG